MAKMMMKSATPPTMDGTTIATGNEDEDEEDDEEDDVDVDEVVVVVVVAPGLVLVSLLYPPGAPNKLLVDVDVDVYVDMLKLLVLLTIGVELVSGIVVLNPMVELSKFGIMGFVELELKSLDGFCD